MTSADYLVERLAGDDDLEGVLEVEADSFTNPWTKAMYVAELRHPEVCHIYVLRTPDCRVAGFIAFWLVVDEMHINNVALRPALRGRGFGTALLTEAFAAAVRLGAARATLEVRRSNVGARRLYERLGFHLSATRPSYYSSPVEDALILWRDPL